MKILWGYRYRYTHSGLIVRVPGRDRPFILLANSKMPSRAANNPGVDGTVTRSFAEKALLNAFVWGEASFERQLLAAPCRGIVGVALFSPYGLFEPFVRSVISIILSRYNGA